MAPGRILLDRFGDLPVLQKATIRSRYGDLKSDDLASRKWHSYASGGSTGEPIHVIHDQMYDDWTRAMAFPIDDILTRRVGERTVILWGSIRDITAARETARARLNNWMRSYVYLDGFKLNAERMSSYVDFINRYRPHHVHAYVESIVELARYIERNHLVVHSPRTVTTSAGSLLPHMREMLSRAFQSEVFNYYGSREFGLIGVECDRHAGMHVPTQTVYVEVLRDDGTPADPGEVGRIVITSLVNYALPLVRYEIGDMGAWASTPCSCGRAWPTLSTITGRISDMFVKPDGGLLAGEYFHAAFGSHDDWVEQFQVVQEEVDKLRVRVVLRRDVPQIDAAKAAGVEELVRIIHLGLGPTCQVAFEFVDEIAATPSGKLRLTISKVRAEGA